MKRRQASESASQARGGRYRGAHSGSTGYHYGRNNFRGGSGAGFGGFRRKTGANRGYGDGFGEEEPRWRRQHGTTHDSLHSMRSRLRAFESVGVGIGVLAVACAASLVVVGTEMMWASVNRGKSFEEVMRELQEKPAAAKAVPRRRRGGGAGKQTDADGEAAEARRPAG